MPSSLPDHSAAPSWLQPKLPKDMTSNTLAPVEAENGRLRAEVEALKHRPAVATSKLTNRRRAMPREIEDNSPFIPIVLTERQAYATLAALKSVFASAQMFGPTDPESRELVKPVAGAMIRMAEALDKAREKAAPGSHPTPKEER